MVVGGLLDTACGSSSGMSGRKSSFIKKSFWFARSEMGVAVGSVTAIAVPGRFGVRNGPQALAKGEPLVRVACRGSNVPTGSPPKHERPRVLVGACRWIE